MNWVCHLLRNSFKLAPLWRHVVSTIVRPGLLEKAALCRFLIGTVAYFPLLTLLFPTPNGLESPINIGLFYVFLCPDPIMNIERENFSMRRSHEIYVLIICLSHTHETYMSLRHRSHEIVS